MSRFEDEYEVASRMTVRDADRWFVNVCRQRSRSFACGLRMTWRKGQPATYTASATHLASDARAACSPLWIMRRIDAQLGIMHIAEMRGWITTSHCR